MLFCWLTKYFCDLPIITPINTKPIKVAPTAVSAIIQFITNIITSTPTTKTVLEIIETKLWFKELPIMSTELDILSITSPCVVESKYFSGNTFILLEMSKRIFLDTFCETPDIMNPCTYDKIALAR